jgi:hypothetical protein
MQLALAFFLLVIGISLVLGTVLMVAGLARAPEGHEDENGFQYANEEGADEVNQLSHPSHPTLA